MKSKEFEMRPFIEMAVILLFMLIGTLIIPEMKGIFVMLPIFYFLIERRVRRRSRENTGFKYISIISELKSTWLLILFVSVILQLCYFLFYVKVMPTVIEHVSARVSFIETLNGKVIFSIIVLALGEEIIFRGLFQKRLSWIMKPSYAIILSSFVFSLMHLSSGEPLIVLLDLTTVFIDSVVFGVIFYKTNNIYISWVAHALANLVSALLIFTNS